MDDGYCIPAELFSTSSEIKNAVENLLLLIQKLGETEKEFYTRFVEAHKRNAHPFDVSELINAFSDGLNPKICTAIHVFIEEREDEPLKFQDIAIRARLQGEGVRTWELNPAPPSHTRRKAPRRRACVEKWVPYARDVDEILNGLRDVLNTMTAAKYEQDSSNMLMSYLMQRGGDRDLVHYSDTHERVPTDALPSRI